VPPPGSLRLIELTKHSTGLAPACRNAEAGVSRRILIAGFKHETHTFSRMPADLEAYRARALYHGDEVASALRGTASEIAGFLDACDAYGWQPVNAVYADATPSGPVTREAFDHVLGCILDAARTMGPVDGLLLCLHGAMVCEHADDGEGALLGAIREGLGRELPIVATHDLHANVSDVTAELLDALVSYRTYPHVDQYDVAREAAALLHDALEGYAAPRVAVARGAMLTGVDHGRTTTPGPMTELLERARETVAADPGILSISVNAGFTMADTADSGPNVVAVTDGEHPGIGTVLEGFVDAMWASRHRETVVTLDVAEMVARIAAAGADGGPVVVADFADNPGGGGYGDSTGVLRALVEANVSGVVAAAFFDPETAAAAHAAGVGATLDVELGGKTDPALGAPLPMRATVRALTDGRFRLSGPMMRGQPVDMGPTAVIEACGVEVVVGSHRFQNYDRMYFEHAGIDPAERHVVVVKSAQHFRAAYAPIAREILVVDSGGGLTTGDLDAFTFRKVRRPIFPLDLD
jgi:microcystin degradation protein MlrC